jgi:hypothetical protein
MAKPETIVTPNVWVATSDALSDTCTVKIKVPALRGTPLSTPLAEASVMPTGRVPLVTVQRYGGVPPEAARVTEYGTLADPPGSAAAVVMTRLDAIFTLNAWLAFTDELSVTCTVKLNVPEPLAVPVIAPVAAFKLKPVGKDPAVIFQV